MLIVVIGILIALALENLVEWMHAREQSQQAMAAIKAELQSDAVNSWERLAVNGCLNERLRDLSRKLAASDGTWRADAIANGIWSQQVVPTVFHAPNRDYTSEAWKAAVGGGSYTRLSKSTADTLRETYEMIRQLDLSQAAEDAAAGRLAPLGYDLRLTPDGRLQMLQSLSEADRSNSFMVLLAGETIEAVARLHLGYDPREVEAAKAAVLKEQRANRGACVTDPPLRLN